MGATAGWERGAVSSAKCWRGSCIQDHQSLLLQPVSEVCGPVMLTQSLFIPLGL